MKQFFILGQNPALSAAEILAVQPAARVLELQREFLIIECKKPLAIEQLGGTIKTGLILSEAEAPDWELFFGDSLNFLQNLHLPKVWFGCSAYGAKIEAKKFGLALKKRLAFAQISARFVVSRSPQLSSVIVQKEHLLDRGAEFVLLVSRQKTYFGQTSAVQEFEDYGRRDYGRPQRDAESGMLPPKVAKMMVNLAGVPVRQVFLDPYCGSGTVLQEALLLRQSRVYGTDLSQKAISDAQINIEWLQQQNSKLKKAEVKIWQCDVRRLENYFDLQTVGAVATEPYLGPALKNRDIRELKIQPSRLAALAQELESLYREAMQQLAKAVVSGGRVVMIWPVWQLGQQNVSLEILSQVTQKDWRVLDLLANLHCDFAERTKRGSIIYRRPGQTVGREIFVFVRQ